MKILTSLGVACLYLGVATQVFPRCDNDAFPGGEPPGSPLLIDLEGDGIVLAPPGVGVYFDLYADGTPDHLQWVRRKGDEAFLVADFNGNGIVDNGSELFGEGTDVVLQNYKASNGFVALSQYDLPALGGNDDGLITADDTIWSLLRVWVDANADGVSQRSELRSLTAAGIKAIETIPKFSRYTDPAGNILPMYSWVYLSGSRKVRMVDVFFAHIP